MTTVANIAQQILDENNYTIADIPLVKMEYLVKNAVDYTNLECGTSITFVPSDGAQSLTGEDSEIFTVKIGSVLLLRAYKDQGPNVSFSGVSITSVITDPQYAGLTSLFTKALEKLKESVNRAKGIPFVVAEDTSGIE